MLTIGKLAAGPLAGRYYVDKVAQGREDYYAGEGESPGEWVGSGVASLGLDGVVGEQGVVRLLNRENPATGELLRRPLASGAVAGFDLTFRAPKSVSVLFGICEPEVVREITLAHEAAVAEAIGYLEREACAARRGHGGSLLVPGRGFVAAAFRHRSSRAGDPLFHTHVVVANATQGPDGRWTALDGRLLYRHAKTAGYLYQASLRAELTERLGLRWHAVERGAADVVGVPRAVIEHFSQRRPRSSSTWRRVASGRRGPRRWLRSRPAGTMSTASRSTATGRSGAPARPSTGSAASRFAARFAVPRSGDRRRTGRTSPCGCSAMTG